MPVHRSRIAVVSMVLGAVLAVGGCEDAGSIPVDTSRVPGVWTGSGGGRVDFRADGRFAMKAIPVEAVDFSFSEPPPGEKKLSGGGTWQKGTDKNTLELRFDAGGSFPDSSEVVHLMVAEAGPPQVLYFSVNSEKAYGYEIEKSR